MSLLTHAPHPSRGLDAAPVVSPPAPRLAFRRGELPLRGLRLSASHKPSGAAYADAPTSATSASSLPNFFLASHLSSSRKAVYAVHPSVFSSPISF